VKDFHFTSEIRLLAGNAFIGEIGYGIKRLFRTGEAVKIAIIAFFSKYKRGPQRVTEELISKHYFICLLMRKVFD